MKEVNRTNIQNILDDRNLNGLHKSLKDFPHFSLLKDMNVATNRIVSAIYNNEKITIAGDYDCDGVAATSLMMDFFSAINYPIDYIIPDRFIDGYGLSASVLDRVDSPDVIITVDNGIVAYDAADICKQRGIDLIITDHHTVGEKLPDCLAVVNPKRADCKYPFKDICGAQVAFLLCASIKKGLGLNTDMTQFLDILTLAVVADVMPLTNINREIVRKGIRIINTFERDFFKNLAYILKKEYFTMDDIAFQIAPRINAAGRLKNASISVDALLSDSSNSFLKTSKLNEINEERKSIQKNVVEQAMLQVDRNVLFNVIVGEELHEGVVGIAASKISEETGKPSLILSELDGGILKGSGRSIGDVDIYKLISTQSDLLEKFGGHKAACGLTIKKESLEHFIEGLQVETAKLDKGLFVQNSVVLGSLDTNDICMETVDLIDRYAPFGEGNPAPIFKCKEAKITKVEPLGKEALHTKITVIFNDNTYSIPLFNTKESIYNIGENIEFTYSLSANIWNGKRTTQLMVRDIKKIA